MQNEVILGVSLDKKFLAAFVLWQTVSLLHFFLGGGGVHFGTWRGAGGPKLRTHPTDLAGRLGIVTNGPRPDVENFG